MAPEPTPAQVEGKSLVKNLSSEIDDLWARAEGRTPVTPDDAEPRAETPEPTRQRDASGRFASTAAPVEPAPTEPVTETTVDPAEIRRQEYERAKAEYEANEQQQQETAKRVQAEAEFSQRVDRYRGSDTDRAALTRALEAANLGNPTALDAIDVTLPNGQKVSDLRGVAGLTPEEAQNVLNGWRQADEYGDALADRKVGQLIGYWNTEVMSVLQDPDVDASAVTQHATPGGQIKAAIDSTRTTVTRRLTEAHTAEVKVKNAEIERLTERVASLTEERGNRRSNDLAAQDATPDRPGAAGAPRRGLPRTAEEIRAMSADEFFKSGTNDELLRRLSPPTPLRRRAV